MSKQTKITCDSCGKDLTFTGNCDGYYITLANTRMASWGGAVTLMAVYPALDHDLTFCGLTCLDLWTTRRQYIAKLGSEWYERWKEDHGTMRDGKCISYTTPTREVEQERDAEFQRMAAERFPTFVAQSA